MNHKKMRDTPIITVYKGYELEDVMDTESGEYDEEQPILSEEVKLNFERVYRED